jgi:hypothetical protein
VLPRALRGPNAVVTNYDGLVGPATKGYAYVRYGPDLLMVGLRSGRVVDVMPGAFTH